MEPPTAQQVQRARADLLSAQQTIAASSELLAAAGISMEMPAHPPLGMEVNAVAVKLPALWPDNPRKWFLHCEAKFRLHRITAQQTMFDHCINVMTAEQSDVVMDLMERGPSPTCYDDLKQAYVERRTPSTAERIQRLRKLGPITDQRPSDLLRLMERILGRSIEGDEIAKEEFVRRLPAQTQLIIRSQAELFIDYVTMAKQQAVDMAVQRLLAESDLQIARCQLPDTEERLLVDMSTGKPRPLLPAAWTRKVFDIHHDLAHAGARAMRRLICDRFVWHGMARDIRHWARTCEACQRAKVSKHVVAPLTPLPMPVKRFDSLHVDLVGPLPASQGFTYLLTIVDRFTRWPEAIPLSDISAITCARAFLYHWVSRYGVPSTLTSDRGRQFVSELWRKTASMLGAATNTTTSYHPQSNGLVERMHRTMKAALKAKLAADPNWVDALPLVMLGMRAAVKEDLNCSAAEMVFGEALRLPGEFFVSADGDWTADPVFVSDLRQRIRQLRPIAPD